MARRNTFAEMKSEQSRLTESWRSEGRLSEAWVVADPEIVEIFSAGVRFGIAMGRRGHEDWAYSPGRVAQSVTRSGRKNRRPRSQFGKRHRQKYSDRKPD